MSHWLVEIIGDRFDIEKILTLDFLTDLSLTEESGRFYLRAREFAVYTEAADVQNCAAQIINVINGIARLQITDWRNVNVGGVDRDEPDGKRSHFLFIDSCYHRHKASSLTLSVTGVTPNTLRQPSIVESAFIKASHNHSVKKAMRIFGSREHNWPNFYIIFEVVESDVGSIDSIVDNGWSTKSEIRRFKHTANSVAALGDDARHGKENTVSPSSPMTLSEAELFIRYLLKQWLSSK